ncbi:MAG: helix-hairpin-helix domain-containing protein [Patescibacteria group bacterium]|nr:helix-hairpin-helix domain-containing protein [Patescibacteria group bacterium]MCL5432300.1 helix-hairpin-helix domain-containing protein [Patescibacteria group bacterium]
MFPEKLSILSPLKKFLPLIMAGAGVILMVAGLTINYFKTNQTTSETLSDSTGVASSAGVIKAKTVKIDISGAVEKPGLYEMPNDSRVNDVLISAGGLAANADRMYVSKSINLAQRLTDGMKIFIPTQEESQNNNLGNLININSATAQELDALPGVGPATATKIITSRPYQSISDLIDRKVVSQSVYDKIKDAVAVY